MAAPAGPTPVRVVAALIAALAIAVPFTASNEGRPPAVYLDGGKVPTGGYGHTGTDVPKVGTVVPDTQATNWLAEDLLKHGLGMASPGCVKPEVIVALPQSTLASLQDFTFNIGVGAFCKSALVKKLNAGDTRGACAQMSVWVYDNGKVVPGLVSRRERSRKLCEKDLK